MALRLLTLCAVVIAAFTASAHVASAQQPPPTNAADVHRQALEWWVSNTQGDSRALSDDEIVALGNSVDGPMTEVQRSAYGKAKPYIELVRTAGRTTQHDLKLDYNKGFDLLLPHLSSMRNATRLLRFDAQVRMQNGDAAGALENLQAMTGIGRQARTDDIVISSLVSASIMSVDDSVIGEALGRGAIDGAKADALLKELDSFRGSDPMNLGPAIRNEGVMFSASVERFFAEPDGMAQLANARGTVDPETQAKLGALTPEEARAQVANYNSLMNRCAEAATNPDRDAARKAIAEISAAVERGDEGELAQLFMPSIGRAMESAWSVADKLAARMTTLEELRDGKRTPESLANAAYAYLRLASLLEGLPDEPQRQLEAARVAGNALDADGLETARHVIAPLRERLQLDFRVASACGRCDFAVRDWRRPLFAPPYLAALRGAARVALTDALLGPSPKGSDGRVRGSDIAPAKPSEAIQWVLTLARHLASDPAIGHSLVASTLLVDASAALDEASRRGLLSAAETASLRTMLGRFDAIDPIAMRAAATKERGLIENSYCGNLPDGSTRRENVHKALLRRDASSLAAILFTTQFRNQYGVADTALGNTAKVPDDAPWSAAQLALPLNGLGDIIDVNAVAAEKQATPQAPNGSGQFSFDPTNADAAAWERMFASFTLKPCEVGTFEAKATAALAAMNELVKEKQ